MPVTSRVSFTPLVVTEFSVQQDWARTYAGTHTTTEQRRQRLLSFQYFLQNLDLGTKPKKTVQPFEPRAPKICHISTVNSTSSNCMEHACRLVIKKITVCHRSGGCLASFPNLYIFKILPTTNKRKEYLALSLGFLPFSHQTNHICNHGLLDRKREENVMKELNIPAFFEQRNI